MLHSSTTRGYRRRRLTRADANLHRRIFWKHHFATSRDEMNVDRFARAEYSHGHAERLRVHCRAENDADHLLATRATGGAFGGIAQRVAADSRGNCRETN